ncbi:hypothetical protein PoB_000773600 [Plakobranchus ocellatus]|uniref:Uncharacterized protein n=1 Tax=Plakobranchus ocellatus TaxID=259542 RepID=A0AAV3Y1Y1_9GAST|nr:hypothetical protein PoB_000773600 [Plakobranchus ocellatus]
MHHDVVLSFVQQQYRDVLLFLYSDGMVLPCLLYRDGIKMYSDVLYSDDMGSTNPLDSVGLDDMPQHSRNHYQHRSPDARHRSRAKEAVTSSSTHSLPQQQHQQPSSPGLGLKTQPEEHVGSGITVKVTPESPSLSTPVHPSQPKAVKDSTPLASPDRRLPPSVASTPEPATEMLPYESTIPTDGGGDSEVKEEEVVTATASETVMAVHGGVEVWSS